MIQSRQRNSSWRKRYLVGSYKIKEKIIGKPVLVETTLQEEFLDQLPDVRDVQHVEGPTIRVHAASPAVDEKYMKELPPLSFQLEPENRLITRPVSEAPTASSIYTRPSPEFPYEFDPAAQVAPLFSGKSKPLNRMIGDGGAPGSGSDSTLRSNSSGKARQAGMNSLGIDTGTRTLWQGASGQTNQLTPILATPATTEVSGSISPVEDQRKSAYFPYHPSDEYPTPESADQHRKETTPSRDTTTTLPPYNRESPPQVSRFSWTTHATGTEGPRTVGPATPETQNSPGSWTSVSPPPYQQRIHQYQQSPTPAGRQRSIPLSNRFEPNTASSQDPPTPDSSPPQVLEMTRPHQVTTPSSSPNPDGAIATTPPSPIMSRSRPLAKPKPASPPPVRTSSMDTTPANPGNNQMRIKRKPTPTLATTMDSAGNLSSPTSPTTATPGSKHKSLPLTPSTLSSIDHITLLQSQLSTLSLRKYNLAKVIASHTALFATSPNADSPSANRKASPLAHAHASARALAYANPMVVDLAARRATKATVAILERDLAEVVREEHDIGLRVMRAQRRRDQEAPSALWVRRVTRVSDDV